MKAGTGLTGHASASISGSVTDTGHEAVTAVASGFYDLARQANAQAVAHAQTLGSEAAAERYLAASAMALRDSAAGFSRELGDKLAEASEGQREEMMTSTIQRYLERIEQAAQYLAEHGKDGQGPVGVGEISKLLDR